MFNGMYIYIYIYNHIYIYDISVCMLLSEGFPSNSDFEDLPLQKPHRTAPSGGPASISPVGNHFGRRCVLGGAPGAP